MRHNIEQQARLSELERTDIKNIKRITPFVVDEVKYTHRVGGILYADSIAGARQGYVALKSLPDDFYQLLSSDVKSNGLLLLAENTKRTHFEHAGGAWIQDFENDGIRDQLRNGVIRIDGRSGTSAHDGIIVKLATKNPSDDIISVFLHEAAHHYWFSVNNRLAQARGLTYGVANNLAHLIDPFYFRNRTINGLHLSRANFNHDYFMALTKHMSGLSIQSAFDIPRLGSIERPGAAYLIFRRPLEYFRDDLQASMEHLLKLKPGAYPQNIEALIRNTELRLYSNEKGAISTFIENLHNLHPQLPYTRIRAAITEANRTMRCELGAHFKQSLVLYPEDTVSLAAPIVQQYKQISASNVEMMPTQVGNYQPQISRTGFQYQTQYSKQGMAARSVMPRFYNVVTEYFAEQARLPVPTIIGKFSTPSYPVIGQPIKIWDVTASLPSYSAKCNLAYQACPNIFVGQLGPQTYYNPKPPQLGLYTPNIEEVATMPWRPGITQGRRLTWHQRPNYNAIGRFLGKVAAPLLIAWDVDSRIKHEHSQFPGFSNTAHNTAVGTDLAIDYGSFALLTGATSASVAKGVLMSINLMSNIANEIRDIPVDAVENNRDFFFSYVVSLDLSDKHEIEMMSAFDRGEQWTREVNRNVAFVTKASYKPFEWLYDAKKGVVDFSRSVGDFLNRPILSTADNALFKVSVNETGSPLPWGAINVSLIFNYNRPMRQSSSVPYYSLDSAGLFVTADEIYHSIQLPGSGSIPWQSHINDIAFQHDDLSDPFNFNTDHNAIVPFSFHSPFQFEVNQPNNALDTGFASEVPFSFHSPFQFEVNQPNNALDTGFASETFTHGELAWRNQFGDGVGDSSFIMELPDRQSQHLHRAMEKIDSVADGFRNINIPQITVSFEIGRVTTGISIGGDEPGIEVAINLSRSNCLVKEKITFLGETYYFKIDRTGKGFWNRYIKAKDYRVTVWREGFDEIKGWTGDEIKDWIETPKRQLDHPENIKLFDKTINNLLSQCASKLMEGHLNQFNQHCDAKNFSGCVALTDNLRQQYTDERTIIAMLNTWDEALKTSQAKDIYEKIKVLAGQDDYQESLNLCLDLKTYLSDQAVFGQIENDLKFRLTLQQHSPKFSECLTDKRFDEASQLIKDIRAENPAVGAIEELAAFWQKQLNLAQADDLIQSGEFKDAYSALLPFCENKAHLVSYIDECKVSKVTFEIYQAIFGDSFDDGRELTNSDRRPLLDILVDLNKIETPTERTRGMVNAKKAEIHHELCDLQQAEHCYAAAREANPLDMSLGLNHAQCLARLNKFDEACNVAEPFGDKVGLRLGVDIKEFTEGQVLLVPGRPITRLSSPLLRPAGVGQDILVFKGLNGETKSITLSDDFLKNLPQDFWSLEEPGKFYDPNISYYSDEVAEYINTFIIANDGVPMRSGDNGAAIVAIREQQYQLQSQHLEVLFGHFFGLTQKAAGHSDSKRMQQFEGALSTANQLFPSALPLTGTASWSGWKNMSDEQKTAWRNQFRLAFRPWLNYDKDKTQAILGTLSFSVRAGNILYANMLRQRLSESDRPHADMAIQCASLGLQSGMTLKSVYNIVMKNPASDWSSFMSAAPRTGFAVRDYYNESQGEASESPGYYDTQRTVLAFASAVGTLLIPVTATLWWTAAGLVSSGALLWGVIDDDGKLEEAYSGVLKNIDYLRRQPLHIEIDDSAVFNIPNRYYFKYMENYASPHPWRHHGSIAKAHKGWVVVYYDKDKRQQDSDSLSLMEVFPDILRVILSDKKPSALTEQDKKQIKNLVTIHHQNKVRTECLRKINAVIAQYFTPSNGSNGQALTLRERDYQIILHHGSDIIQAPLSRIYPFSYVFYQTKSGDTNVVGRLKHTLWILQAEKALSQKDDVAYLAITKTFKSGSIFKFTHMDCAIELYSNFILYRLESLAKLGEGNKFFEEIMTHCAYLWNELEGDGHEKFTSQFKEGYKQCIHLLIQKTQEWFNGEDLGLKEKAKIVAIKIFDELWKTRHYFNLFQLVDQKSVLSVPMQTLLAEILMGLEQDDEGLAIFHRVPAEKQDDNYWASFAKAYLRQSKINKSFKCISKITLLNENLEALSVLTGLLNRLIKTKRRGDGKYYLLHYILGYYVTAFTKHENFNGVEDDHKLYFRELEKNALDIKQEGERLYPNFCEVISNLFQQLESGDITQAVDQVMLGNTRLTASRTKLPTHHTVEEQPRTMFFKYNSDAKPSRSCLKSSNHAKENMPKKGSVKSEPRKASP